MPKQGEWLRKQNTQKAGGHNTTNGTASRAVPAPQKTRQQARVQPE